MDTLLFDSKITEFTINPATLNLSGLVEITDNFLFQPFGGLAKNRSNDTPLKNSVQLGLRTISEFTVGGIVQMRLVSETKTLIIFTKPENEQTVFNDFADKAIKEHTKHFDTKKAGTVFQKDSIRNPTKDELLAVQTALLSFFRSLF